MHKQHFFMRGTSMWVLIYVIYIFLARMLYVYVINLQQEKSLPPYYNFFSSQFLLMFFSSHNKRRFGKYPWALGPLDQR
jgi:hypothetical protein